MQFLMVLLCALIFPLIAHAEIYAGLKGGGTFLSNEDVNAFSKPPSPMTGPTISGNFYSMETVYIGYRFNDRFSLEAAWDLNQTRTFENDYYNGGTKVLHISISNYAYSFCLAPAYSFELYAQKALAGFKIGRAAFLGHIAGQSLVSNQSGSYDDAGSTTALGAFFRFEKSVTHQIDLGGELGYNYTKFSTVTAQNGQGVYSGASGNDTDSNGQPASFDFSGPYIQLYLQYNLR